MKKLFYMALLCLPVMTFGQEGFTPHGIVNGRFFGDYYYKVAGDTGLTGEYKGDAEGDNGFAIRRVYLGYDYHFAENMSASILLESNDGLLNSGDKRVFAVKKALFKWKDIYSGGTLIVGAQSTPTWSLFTEKEWGYRSIEKNIMDFRKHGSSNDVGVMLSGHIPGMKQIGYNVMVGNGRGQKPENNKYKKIMGSLNAKLLDEKLRLEIYADNEKTAESSSITNIKGYIGVNVDKFVAGVEPYIRNENSNSVTVSYFGMQVFVKGSIVPKLGFFIRTDIYQPDEDAYIYNEMFSVVGLDYTPVKNVSFMPNIWINYYSGIDSSAPDQAADVIARLTMKYKF